MENIKSNKFKIGNVITVVFVQAAGGMTLINALGLSTSCFFGHPDLINLELKNKFDSKEKFMYLMLKLNEFKRTNVWNDLSMRMALTRHMMMIMDNTSATGKSDKFIFRSAHKVPYPSPSINSIMLLPSFTTGGFNYKDKKLQTFIVFFNEDKIVSRRRSDSTSFFKDTLERYNSHNMKNVDADIKEALKQHNKKTVIDYDASNLLDTDKFTESVVDLMKYFNMEIPNIEYIKEYHKLWHELNIIK